MIGDNAAAGRARRVPACDVLSFSANPTLALRARRTLELVPAAVARYSNYVVLQSGRHDDTNARSERGVRGDARDWRSYAGGRTCGRSIPPALRRSACPRPRAGCACPRGHEPLRLQGHPPQRRGRRRSSPDKIADRGDQGVPRGERRAGRGVSAGARDGRAADANGGRGAGAPPAVRRHVPHRGHPGPGRARADALRRARGGPLLRAVPRGARASARPGKQERRRAAVQACTWSTANVRRPLDLARASRAHHFGLRRTGRRGRAEAVLGATLKNLYDGVPDRGGAQVRHPLRAHADRAGPGLHLRHRAPAAAHDPPRGAGRGGRARRRWPRATPSTSPTSSRGHQGGAARRGAAPVRPGALGAALVAGARPAVRLPRPADPVRPLLPALDEQRIELPQAFFMRVAMGLALERDRPRGARDRVLPPALHVRLHELDADPVQLGHAAFAAVLLLPDHGVRTTSTASTRRSRRTRCSPSTRAAWATTGRRCARWAPHQGHQRQVARASCRS